jgi:hypothetical protein
MLPIANIDARTEKQDEEFIKEASHPRTWLLFGG